MPLSPTSVVIPGASCMRSAIPRRVGTSSRISFSKFVPVPAFLTSTMGDSPTTVTVSVTEATFSVMGMVAVAPMPTDTLSKRTISNPGSSACTE